MQFLKAVNLDEKVEVGKRVDAARVARRIESCEEVILIYRRTRAEMPAFEEEIEARRPTAPRIPASERVKGCVEVECRLSEEMAVKEARRCLRCDLGSEERRRWPRM